MRWAMKYEEQGHSDTVHCVPQSVRCSEPCQGCRPGPTWAAAQTRLKGANKYASPHICKNKLFKSALLQVMVLVLGTCSQVP